MNNSQVRKEFLNSNLTTLSTSEQGIYHFPVPEYKTETKSTNEGVYISFYAIDKPEIDVAEEKFKLMLASESVLKKDWNKPEEDEAWASL